ncbi:MAG: transcriptional repressor [Proteobacteria bacterium]|nr:transcriptional repressor [Pseudomonadota bacterium]
MPEKLTPHARKVFDLLKDAGKPLTAYAILDKLRRHGFRSPPQVYRALDWLLKHGLVHRLESMNSFVACQHHEEDEHISQFVLCTSCGKVQEIENKSLIKLAKKLGEKFLAKISKEVFELSGTCHACRAKEAKA